MIRVAHGKPNPRNVRFSSRTNYVTWVPGADAFTQAIVLHKREHAHRVFAAIQAVLAVIAARNLGWLEGNDISYPVEELALKQACGWSL